jgi:putative hemolysin
MIRLHHGTDTICVRLAQNDAEIEAAQHLRYKVFYEEYAATPSPDMARLRRDFDSFDPVTDHLIVLDAARGQGPEGIVGTYRLLRESVAQRAGGFYSSGEYDIGPVLGCGVSVMELGRSCVLPEYRTRPVLQMLWKGIADYVTTHDVGLMFGCASLHGTDIGKHSKALAYMYHHHLAPESLRPRALADQYVDMNLHPAETLDSKAIFADLPPLVKGYLRLGASVGDGAVIDHQFNTTDVCIVLPTTFVNLRYRKHYERSTQKSIPGIESLPADHPLLRESA